MSLTKHKFYIFFDFIRIQTYEYQFDIKLLNKKYLVSEEQKKCPSTKTREKALTASSIDFWEWFEWCRCSLKKIALVLWEGQIPEIGFTDIRRCRQSACAKSKANGLFKAVSRPVGRCCCVVSCGIGCINWLGPNKCLLPMAARILVVCLLVGELVKFNHFYL